MLLEELVRHGSDSELLAPIQTMQNLIMSLEQVMSEVSLQNINAMTAAAAAMAKTTKRTRRRIRLKGGAQVPMTQPLNATYSNLSTYGLMRQPYGMAGTYSTPQWSSTYQALPNYKVNQQPYNNFGTQQAYAQQQPQLQQQTEDQAIAVSYEFLTPTTVNAPIPWSAASSSYTLMEQERAYLQQHMQQQQSQLQTQQELPPQQQQLQPQQLPINEYANTSYPLVMTTITPPTIAQQNQQNASTAKSSTPNVAQNTAQQPMEERSTLAMNEQCCSEGTKSVVQANKNDRKIKERQRAGHNITVEELLHEIRELKRRIQQQEVHGSRFAYTEKARLFRDNWDSYSPNYIKNHDGMPRSNRSLHSRNKITRPPRYPRYYRQYTYPTGSPFTNQNVSSQIINHYTPIRWTKNNATNTYPTVFNGNEPKPAQASVSQNTLPVASGKLDDSHKTEQINKKTSILSLNKEPKKKSSKHSHSKSKNKKKIKKKASKRSLSIDSSTITIYPKSERRSNSQAYIFKAPSETKPKAKTFTYNSLASPTKVDALNKSYRPKTDSQNKPSVKVEPSKISERLDTFKNTFSKRGNTMRNIFWPSTAIQSQVNRWPWQGDSESKLLGNEQRRVHYIDDKHSVKATYTQRPNYESLKTKRNPGLFNFKNKKI